MRWDGADEKGYVWQKTIDSYEEKAALGVRAAALASDGDVIGVGTGSSSYLGLVKLADRVKNEGLRVTVVPAAMEIRLACASLGVPCTGLESIRPDWCFDGADAIACNGDVIKGRGGGLFMEKLIIASCEKRFLLAGKGKFVESLSGRKLPVEVFPAAVRLAQKALAGLGAEEVVLRPAVGKDGPAVTEFGNVILDCRFAAVRDGLEKEIKAVPGVIECGLFQGFGFSFIGPEA
ncbi:MAG: ribose 5-phosphate isomerase A [Oscillospiraceae bacterium]|nr:ribose 5-phosphate isomerase A [Oscillospiraceae bacterium]